MAVLIATDPGIAAKDQKLLKFHKHKKNKRIKNILICLSIGMNILLSGVLVWITIN